MTWEIGRARRGFSLLELIISLGLIALLATFFAVRFSNNPVEGELMDCAVHLKQFASRASRLSSAFRTSQSVLFREKGELPSGVRFELLRLREKEFRPPLPEGESWLFESTGLAEPIQARFAKEDAYIELEFNPLTAHADVERSYFPE